MVPGAHPRARLSIFKFGDAFDVRPWNPAQPCRYKVVASYLGIRHISKAGIISLSQSSEAMDWGYVIRTNDSPLQLPSMTPCVPVGPL
jgi:hypothetical protein